MFTFYSVQTVQRSKGHFSGSSWYFGKILSYSKTLISPLLFAVSMGIYYRPRAAMAARGSEGVNHESGVSPVSKRYMRAGIGNDRLVVCLSEYLP